MILGDACEKCDYCTQNTPNEHNLSTQTQQPQQKSRKPRGGKSSSRQGLKKKNGMVYLAKVCLTDVGRENRWRGQKSRQIERTACCPGSPSKKNIYNKYKNVKKIFTQHCHRQNVTSYPFFSLLWQISPLQLLIQDDFYHKITIITWYHLSLNYFNH